MAKYRGRVYQVQAFSMMPSGRMGWSAISGRGDVLVGDNYSGFSLRSMARRLAESDTIRYGYKTRVVELPARSRQVRPNYGPRE